MPIIHITDINDPAVAPFASLTERQLNSATGLFIAESPKVIKVAISAGYVPESMLCEERHIEGDASEIITAFPDMPVYTASRQELAKLTGYTLTRGVLCAFKRPSQPSVADVCKDARRVVVIDDVCDTTNIGAIFRSAAALGADAVLLSPTACDPFNRRSIRVSMGTVFLVPWTRVGDDITAQMHELGIKTVALALTDRSVPMDDAALNAESRLALIMGTEGEGLPQATIDAADYTARIPMSHGVDSLNVAAASAVAMYQLRLR